MSSPNGTYKEPSTDMGRCAACSSWWLLAVGRCGCGGELVAIDMAKHAESLPRAAYDRAKDATKDVKDPKP